MGQGEGWWKCDREMGEGSTIWLSWPWDVGQRPWVLGVLGRGVRKVQGCVMVAGGFLQTLEVIQSADHEIHSQNLSPSYFSLRGFDGLPSPGSPSLTFSFPFFCFASGHLLLSAGFDLFSSSTLTRFPPLAVHSKYDDFFIQSSCSNEHFCLPRRHRSQAQPGQPVHDRLFSEHLSQGLGYSGGLGGAVRMPMPWVTLWLDGST